MHPGKRLKVFLLVLTVLLAGFVSGCGGGGQSEDRSQGGGDSAKQSGEKARKKKAPETKIALGTIVFINPEKDVFTLRKGSVKEGSKPVPYRLLPKAKINIDGEKASVEDMEQGQQAQVKYFTKKTKKGEEVNLAREVEAFKAGGGSTTGEGETTG